VAHDVDLLEAGKPTGLRSGFYLSGAPPRFATPRTDRPTLGGEVTETAQALGVELMPWQRYVVDVALEIDPATGRLVYREVVLSVPRQQGKTLLLLCLMAHRAWRWDSQQVLYASASRNLARKKFLDEYVPRIGRVLPAGAFEVRRALGSEAIRFDNGSFLGITSTTERAGHGDTLDLGVVDEAWTADARLEQGFRPTMITRPQPQLWVVSTAGTAESAYMKGKVDAGRMRTQAGLSGSVAFFEWSAAPDCDLGDPETWPTFLPALCSTIPATAIQSELEAMPPADFARAYGNQWPGERPGDWLVVDRLDWEALEDGASKPKDPLCFAVEVNPERTAASIAVAGRRGDELLHVEVVEHRPGTSWVAARMVELSRRHRPVAVVLDTAGPAGSLVTDLETAGLRIVKPSMPHACGAFYDKIKARGLRHLGQPALAVALGGARKRPVVDAWTWERRRAEVDLSPLVAVTLAAWGLGKAGTDRPRIRVFDI
jgi:hypothetical protein